MILVADEFMGATAAVAAVRAAACDGAIGFANPSSDEVARVCLYADGSLRREHREGPFHVREHHFDTRDLTLHHEEHIHTYTYT